MWDGMIINKKKAMQEQIKFAAAILFLLVFLPVLGAAVLSGKKALEFQKTPDFEGVLPLLLYQEIPDGFGQEAAAAQAVLLRSRIYIEAEELGREAYYEELVRRNLEAERRNELDEEKMSVCRKALDETEGLMLAYGADIVEGPFCRASSGWTRNGKEAMGDESWGWLVAVESSEDLDYRPSLAEAAFTEEELYENLKEALEEGGGENGGTEENGAQEESRDKEEKGKAAEENTQENREKGGGSQQEEKQSEGGNEQEKGKDVEENTRENREEEGGSQQEEKSKGGNEQEKNQSEGVNEQEKEKDAEENTQENGEEEGGSQQEKQNEEGNEQENAQNTNIEETKNGAAALIKEGILDSIEIVAKDSSGYVTDIRAGGVRMSGEKFRQALGLPSASFTVSRQEDTVRIVCRGEGHGLGLSQNGAAAMEEQGAGFREILNRYFPNAQITEKNFE